MKTYLLELCTDCANRISGGIVIEPNPTMGEIGIITITGTEFEFKRSDCGACGVHMSGDFIEAEEVESI